MKLQLFADPPVPPVDPPNPPPIPDPPAPKTLTQEEVDRVVQDRLKRERKAWETQAEDERKKAAMTAEEKAKADLEAERKARADDRTAAQAERVAAKAEAVALRLGVKPERVEHLLKLANLTGAVDADGKPDVKAIEGAINAVLKDIPELKGNPTPGKSGGEFNGNGGGEANPWDPATFNLTKQGEIIKTNPEKAAQMMAAAKKK